MPAGPSTLALAYPGRYALSGPADASLRIAGREVRSGEEVRLERGSYDVVAVAGQRLHLVPDGIEAVVDARYARPRPLFDAAYTY